MLFICSALRIGISNAEGNYGPSSAAVREKVPGNVGVRACVPWISRHEAARPRGVHAGLSSGESIAAPPFVFRVKARDCPMKTLRRFASMLGLLLAWTVCFFLECLEQLAQMAS